MNDNLRDKLAEEHVEDALASKVPFDPSHSFKVGFDEAMKHARGLADSIQAFIDKTQEQSKITGENAMKAPHEYVAMLAAVTKFKRDFPDEGT